MNSRTRSDDPLSSPATTRRPAARRWALLDLDPDLSRRLTGERWTRARAEVRVRGLRRGPGPWPINGTSRTRTRLRLLILDGLVARDVSLEDVVSTELLGAGDVICPAALGDPDHLLHDQADWHLLTECRFAVIDDDCASALAAFPEITDLLVERLERRSQRLARTQAIVALTRVDRRILAMLWLLAERWGRVTSEGVLLPLDISHRLLGQLIGARRPTVSTAASELTKRRLVRRRVNGAWVLLGEPTGVPVDGLEHPFSRRKLRTDERARG